MSNIDKQRVAAVTSLEAAGYRWDGNMWVRPEGFNPVDTYEPLERSLRLLAQLHTTDDAHIGFVVHMRMGQMQHIYSGHEPADYIEAWRKVRKHLGLST